MPANRLPPAGKSRYFPKLKGSLIVGSVGLMAFLATWEGGGEKDSIVYADKLAQGLPTVCHGLTKYSATVPVIVGEKWPAAKCVEQETAAVSRLQIKLADCFKILPPQIVFDMATSHAWNNGLSATCGSGAMSAWQDGDWRTGCRRLAFSDSGKRVWSYVKTGRIVNGKPEYKFVQGLANRRSAEYKTCITGSYQ